MTEFPIPAYELAETRKYFLGSIQYSSGCPYQCEFCDIPGLYGRNPRLKTPEQIVAELDKLRECGMTDAVYFVDDNFIGNRKAALDLLPHLIEWQKRTGYVCGSPARRRSTSPSGRRSWRRCARRLFVTVFCGIETPDPDALKAMHKDHNMMVPILEGIHTINSYGMEVVSGIIMGLDTDKPDTADALLDFIEASRIPMLTINLLQALPQTPLWDRLEREGRLIDDDGRESNVDFRLPYEQVVGRGAVHGDRLPAGELFARYQHQCDYTYANRIKVPVSAGERRAGATSGAAWSCCAYFLEGRGARRLPEGVLEIRPGRLRRGEIEDLIVSA